jgi:hypothetical protein
MAACGPSPQGVVPPCYARAGGGRSVREGAHQKRPPSGKEAGQAPGETGRPRSGSLWTVWTSEGRCPHGPQARRRIPESPARSRLAAGSRVLPQWAETGATPPMVTHSKPRSASIVSIRADDGPPFMLDPFRLSGTRPEHSLNSRHDSFAISEVSHANPRRDCASLQDTSSTASDTAPT